LARKRRQKKLLHAPERRSPEGLAAAYDVRAIAVTVGLTVLVAIIYGQVRTHQFIDFDDPLYVSANEQVLRGLTWSGVRWAFTHIHAGYWLPLTWISHMIDVQLFGRDAGAHLLMNVALHAINCALLFLLLRLATAAVWRSAIVAALFAVHPLHAESVAWISERKDTLSTLFFLLALLAYTRYIRSASRSAYVASVVALAFGLMAKPMLVTAPFILLLLDYWPFDRFQRPNISRLLIEKVPFAAAVLGAIVATLLAQHEGMAATTAISLPARLANAAISYVRYIAKTLWPSGLAVIYPFPTNINSAAAVACAVLIIAVTVVVILLRGSFPWLFVGWLWFAGALIPVIGIVQVGLQAMADRFTYIPHIGLFIAIVWGIAHAVERLPRLRPIAAGIAGAVVLAFAVVSCVQVRYWANSISLFEHALAVTSPANKLAHVDLGAALLDAGEYEAAESHYRQAEGFQPAETVYIGLSLAFLGEGKLDAAADAARRAVAANPNSAAAASTLGSAELARGDLPEARRALARSLQLENDPAIAARLAFARGQLEEARAGFAEAIARKADDADLRNSYAAILARLGNDAQAEQEYAEALRLNPNSYDARMNYGALVSRLGRYSDAMRQFSEAGRIRPHSPEPHVYLGLLAAKQNHFDLASREIAQAMSTDHNLSNRLLIEAIRIPARPTAIDEYLTFLRQQSGPQ
jgi:Flp pilus assembly protein TadD